MLRINQFFKLNEKIPLLNSGQNLMMRSENTKKLPFPTTYLNTFGYFCVNVHSFKLLN